MNDGRPVPSDENKTFPVGSSELKTIKNSKQNYTVLEFKKQMCDN